ncbi:MAG: tail fiber domain-containing protein, partial [Bacteroidales bacterium]|nr:tail fiber domain-containing protein [Bacteroidales bacterium]
CTQVVDDPAGYYCYFNQKQGTVANLFVVGDFAMGQMFDPTNLEVRYYKARVDEIGSNYILLSKTDKDGDGAPAVGDTIVQHGHESNTARQFVIVRDVIGGGYERMLSGLDAVDAEGDEYYFAGRLASQGPRWFVGDSLGEYAEWVNGRLNIKGTLVVRNADGTYQAMTDYMAGVSDAMQGLQAQIDGQIQSWSSGEAETPQTEPFPQVVDDVVDPTTANFPAEDWALDTDRERHFGDIYVDDSTGQGYRYTKRLKNGVTEYYWTRITDEEVAEAMRLARQANQGVAGLQYLRAATNNGATLVDGGLILSNLMALGQTVSQQFQVTAGINGIMNAERTRLGGGLAAWFGGDISDKDDLDQGVTAYAKSVFRFDGSGYLAGGNIHWDQNGYGGIPGITWSRPSGSQQDVITIGANVMLESAQGSDSRVTDLITLVQGLSNMFLEVEYTVGQETRKYVKLNPARYDGIAAEGFGVFASSANFTPGGGGGGGADLGQVWQSLQNAGSPVEFATNLKFHQDHLPAAGTGLAYTVNSAGLATGIGIASGYKLPNTTEWNNKADASALAGYLPLSGGQLSGDIRTASFWSGTDSVGVYFEGLSDAGLRLQYPKTISGSSRSNYDSLKMANGVLSFNNNTVWHAGNDGSGSGLDADLLDGQHGDYYATANVSIKFDFTPNYVAARFYDAAIGQKAGETYIEWWQSNRWFNHLAGSYKVYGGTSSHFLKGDGSLDNTAYLPLSGGTLTGVLRGTRFSLGTGNNGLYKGSDWTSYLTADDMVISGYGQKLWIYGNNIVFFSADNIYRNSGSESSIETRYKIWDEGNDGADSGLDADLLDGRHASGFIHVAGADNFDCNEVGTLSSSYRFSGTPSNAFPNAAYGNMLVIGYYDTLLQLGGPYNTQELYFRSGTWANSGGSIRTASWNKMWHSANSNSTSVPWSASSLSLAGAISGATNIDSLLYFDTTNSRVGIGAAPSYKFDVSGTLRTTGDATFNANALVSGKLYLSATSYMEYVSSNSGIHSNVGIYSDSYITAATSNTSSDARLKDNIQSIGFDKAISMLNALRGCEWDWNGKNDYLAGKHGSGLVAQEVMGVMPWAVLDLNGEYRMSYNTLWGVAVPVMQSHEERIK